MTKETNFSFLEIDGDLEFPNEDEWEEGIDEESGVEEGGINPEEEWEESEEALDEFDY